MTQPSHTPTPLLQRPLTTWLCTLTLIVLMASSPAVTRLAVAQTLTLYDLLLLRCGLGAVFMLPVLLAHRHAIPRKLWAAGLLLAFCQGWGMHFATIAGLQYAPAAHASALGPGFVPVWVALWTWVFYRGLPTRPQFTGLVLIAVGAVVLLANSRASAFQPHMLAGDLFFLLSSALAGIYLTYVQRNNVPTLQGAALVAVYSGIVYVPWFLWAPVESRLAIAPWSEIIWQSVYQGAGVGALFIVMLNFVVLRLGGQRFSILGASVPVLALLFGRWIAGDGISLGECIAVAFVSGGVLYGAFVGRTRAAATELTPAVLRT
jgi:drug/metabolite transporter (DMT)-like permease